MTRERLTYELPGPQQLFDRRHVELSLRCRRLLLLLLWSWWYTRLRLLRHVWRSGGKIRERHRLLLRRRVALRYPYAGLLLLSLMRRRRRHTREAILLRRRGLWLLGDERLRTALRLRCELTGTIRNSEVGREVVLIRIERHGRNLCECGFLESASEALPNR